MIKVIDKAIGAAVYGVIGISLGAVPLLVVNTLVSKNKS